MTAPPAAERRQTLVCRVVLGSAALVLLGIGLGLRHGPGAGSDLQAYLDAARRVTSGASPYLPATVHGPFRPGPLGLYLYSPPVAVAMVPLSLLSASGALLVWLVVRVGLLAAACALLPVKPWVRAATMLVCCADLQLLTDLTIGNVSIVVLALLALGWRWVDRPAGAVALGLALLLRPPLAVIPVWQLLRRRPRCALITVSVALAAVGLVLPVTGLAAPVDFLRVLAHVTDAAHAPHNVAVGATLARLGLSAPWPGLASALSAAIAVLVVLAAARSRDAAAGYLAVAAASVLLPSLMWPHYLVVVVLVAALLADRGHPWALAVPLLGWFPAPVLPLLALLAAVAPLVLARRPEAHQPRSRHSARFGRSAPSVVS